MKALNEIPSSVYRLQLNGEFPLKSAIALIPYLNQLGLEGVYCSPIFKSASPHGYDVVNPNQLNPLLGTLEEYDEFCTLLKEHKMKQILDVVPNHMGIKEGKNQWWLDVLENGPSSTYADFFDIDWDPITRELKDKVLLPILGDIYGKSLENQEFQLSWKEDNFWIDYGDYRLPVAAHSYAFIFDYPLSGLDPSLPKEEAEWKECLAIGKELKKLQEETNGKTEEKKKKKLELASLFKRSEYVRLRMEALLKLFNGTKGDNESFILLHDLLEKQYYRLAHWIVGGQEINYRRFFNINDLVALHIERERVLREHHAWVFQLIETGKVQGVRIDHPDGLYRPDEYFLRVRAKGVPLIVVEKILDFKESLPARWEVEGSVGYDFLALLNGIFINKEHESIFAQIYEKFINKKFDFEKLLYERKKRILRLYMGSEIGSLGWRLDQLSEKNIYFRDYTKVDLTEVLQEIIASFPVYRTYLAPGKEISKKERDYIVQAVEKAKIAMPEIDPSVYNYVKEILLLESPHLHKDPKESFDFLLRFQQLTPPVMAKALEDSCFYIYNRFISLNEVGSSPRNFGISKSEFDHFNHEKLEKWPLGFLASSTHDSKFSEDVRMRLNVLSEIPQKWKELVFEWQEINEKHKQEVMGSLFPDANIEYYLYQLLLGFLPPEESEVTPPLFERLWNVIFKIVREAGVYTSWLRPHEHYEKNLKQFLTAILTPSEENLFFLSFLSFLREVAIYGRWNSLSSVILKMGSCGIVDIFQGNECWNFALVDPDNRRLVDYETREKSLQSLDGEEISDEFLRLLFKNCDQMGVKQFFTAKALQFRRDQKDLFLRGEYTPLSIEGERKENVVAFMRKEGEKAAIVISGRFFTKLVSQDELPIGKCWADSFLVLPKWFEGKNLKDIFTLKTHHLKKAKNRELLPLEEIFSFFPYAILDVS